MQECQLYIFQLWSRMGALQMVRYIKKKSSSTVVYSGHCHLGFMVYYLFVSAVF